MRLIIAFSQMLLVAVACGLAWPAGGNSLAAHPSASAVASYKVSAISYALDPANPTLIASVRFTLDPTPDFAGSTVRAKLAGASYVTCALTATNSWECPFAGVAVARADHLTVDVIHSAVSSQRRIYLPFVRR